MTRNYIVMSNEPFEYCGPTSIFSWKEPFLRTLGYEETDSDVV